MKKALWIAGLLIVTLGSVSVARDGGQYIYDSQGNLVETNRTVPPGEPPVQQSQPKLTPAWQRSPENDGVEVADQNGQNPKIRVKDDGPVEITGPITITAPYPTTVKANPAGPNWFWTPQPQPSALSADAPNGFGLSGASVSADTMSYDDLIALWDGIANNFPGYVVNRVSIGLDASSTYPMYCYTFSPGRGDCGPSGCGVYDQTVAVVTGQHAGEWGPVLAVWRAFYLAQQGQIALPQNVRYLVVPCGNPWAWMRSPRAFVNVNGINPNRQYPYNWSASTDPTKGAAPLTEAETINIVNLLKSTDVTAILDFHNQTPDSYDYMGYFPNPPAFTNFGLVERVVRFLSPNPSFGVWTGNAEPGLWNWAGGVLGVNAFSAEAGSSGADGTYAGAQWMTKEVGWVANLILSFSQPDAIIPSRPVIPRLPHRGAVLTYDFLDGTGTTATDILPGGSNGSLAGTTPPTWTRYGVNSGPTGYIDTGKTRVGNTGLFAASPEKFTVVVVSRQGVTTAGSPISRAGATQASRTFQLYSQGTYDFLLNIRGSITTLASAEAGYWRNDGSWHAHFVIWNGSACTYQMDDGSMVRRTCAVGTAAEETTEHILFAGRTISGLASTFNPTGDIAFGQVYDWALSNHEIMSLYAYLRNSLAQRSIILP